jgi:ABC-type lipoprotein release transport system permease subunit
MVFRLAVRNLGLNCLSRLPQALMVALTVALLFVGNSLLESSRQGLAATYRLAFTGDASVSARAEDNFTLFGSDLPLIGEYVVTPPLPAESVWRPTAESLAGRTEWVPQVSASGILLLPNAKKVAVPVFGVDAPAYFRFFPSLVLEEGTLTPSDPRALWLNRSEWKVLAEALGHPPEVGESFDLGMTVRGSFVIRTVRLAGIYRYPGTDPALDRTLLVDPQTARALNGYTAAGVSAAEVAPENRNLLSTDLDALFDQPGDQVAPATGGTDLEATQRRLGETSGRDAANRTLDGVWNFVLFKAKNPGDLGWTGELQSRLDRAGLDLQVRDWVGTAGGNALVVSLLQILFSVGLGLVALVSALIVMNSLALSVVERTQEIGTWRALGATQVRVASVIALETSTLILASALVGLAAASLALAALSGRGIPLHNPILASLLGTDRLHPSFSAKLWVGHLFLALVLALTACWLPIRRALAISPLKAMQSEASS